MISLDKDQTCLLELIKASLFVYTPAFPENANWDKVFELAKSQCIVPLVASCVPEEHRNEWLDISGQSKAHFMRMLYEQNLLVRLLNANSIPFVIFKGTAAAIYYSVPSLRTFGDIDFYVPEEFFDSAKNLLEHNEYRFIDNNDRHFEYEKNGICFELHNKISRQGVFEIDHIVLNDLDSIVECSLNNFAFPCLPTYKNGLILLWHIAHHLKTFGIGYRQIIDWMMFVNKELDDDAWNEHFRSLAHEAGLEKIAITVTYMCKKWLGLTKVITWCDIADKEVTDQLLIRILDDGNFGHYRAPSERINKSIKKEGLFKYLQRSGMLTWPLAQKYAFFRPFAWLHQLFRYAGKGIVGLFKGEKVFMKNKHNMSIDELWERLE